MSSLWIFNYSSLNTFHWLYAACSCFCMWMISRQYAILEQSRGIVGRCWSFPCLNVTHHSGCYLMSSQLNPTSFWMAVRGWLGAMSLSKRPQDSENRLVRQPKSFSPCHLRLMVLKACHMISFTSDIHFLLWSNSTKYCWEENVAHTMYCTAIIMQWFFLGRTDRMHVVVCYSQRSSGENCMRNALTEDSLLFLTRFWV